MEQIDIVIYKKSNNILLILTGIGGTTKGYENKYEKIAKLIMQKYDFSVVVATTPKGSWTHLKENLYYIINRIAEKFEGNFQIYAMGSSAGANILLCFSYLFPQIKRILAINPVLNINFHWIEKGIAEFNKEKIYTVFGEHDPSIKWTEILPKNNKLIIKILPNVDHKFTNNLQTFIELPQKILFTEE